MAMGLLIVLVIITVANQRLIDLTTQKVMTEARSGVKDLSDTANEVYKQGYGARKNVFIKIPTDTDFDRSYIGTPPGATATASRTINLNVKDTDITALTDGPVSGAFPRSSGGHWLKVESKGSFVSIGSYFLQLDSGSLHVQMHNNSHQNATVRAYNVGNETITVTTQLTWTNVSAGMNMSMVWSNATIPAGTNSNASFNFTFDSGYLAGIYSGDVVFFANTTSGGTAINESLTLPIAAEVTISPFYPAYNNATINLSTVLLYMFTNLTNSTITIGKNVTGGGPANNREITLFICAQPGTNITNVSVYSLNYSQSSFFVGSQPWYAGPINPNACISRVVNFTSSLSALTGSSAETIAATATNGSTYAYYYTAYIGVNVSIDATGPNVTNASHSPAYPQISTLVTIHANITDSGGALGQSWIENCTAWVNGSVYYMAPNDGLFNTTSEGANTSMTPANDGTFLVNVSCNDTMGNYGANRSINFTVDSVAPIILAFGASCGAVGAPCNSGTYSNGTQYFTFTASQALFFNMSVNDTGRGGSSISDCNFSIDGGTVYSVNATDGMFDSAFEYGNATIGTLSAGDHVLTANCSDVYGNGASNTTNFIVGLAACQNLGTASKTYALSQNVNSSGTCFNVTASGVTLNCAGYSITGTNATNTSAVFSNMNLTALQNCNVSNYSYGILFNQSNNSVISGGAFNSSSSSAIWLAGATNASISGVTATGTDAAYSLYATGTATTSGLSISSSTFNATGSMSGARFDYITGATFSGITAQANGGVGFYCWNCNNSIFTGGTCVSNASTGFYLTGSNNSVQGGTMISTTGSGISMSGASNNTLNGMNASSGSIGIGIFGTSNYNTIANSSITCGMGGSTPYAILLTGAIFNNFTNNNITANCQRGISIASTVNDSIFTYNRITANNSAGQGVIVIGPVNAFRNTFLYNNLTQINDTATANGAYVINMLGTNLPNQTFAYNLLNATNGTFLRNQGTGRLLNFTYNTMVGTATMWINNTDASANFSILVGGKWQGNSYPNTTLYDCVDSDAIPDGYCDSGTAYPFNATTLGALWGGGVTATGIGNDSGPATTRTAWP
jgi:hypothetical protein